MADSARKRTDKMLHDLERRISDVYASDPSLIRIQKRYQKYMDMVSRRTEASYKAFRDENDKDIKADLKKAYMDEIKALTIENKTYRNIVSEFTRVMAEVNQKALDLVNAEMANIYTTNYNQVATLCRKVGIAVDGDEV